MINVFTKYYYKKYYIEKTIDIFDNKFDFNKLSTQMKYFRSIASVIISYIIHLL